MGLRRTSQPLTTAAKLTVVTLAEAKAQARVTHTAEDALITAYIETAFDFLHGPDGWLNGYCLLKETFEYIAEPRRPEGHLRFRCGRWSPLEFPLRPVTAFTSVEYAADATTYATLTPDMYGQIAAGDLLSIQLASVPGMYGTGWPGTSRIRLVADAGHVSPATIPAPLKQAIKMLVAEMYGQRELSAEVASSRAAFGLQALAGRYRFEPDHS